MSNEEGVKMEFLKKYKKWIILGVVCIVLLAITYGFVNLLFPNSSKSAYGNRLDGMDAVAIKGDTVSQITQDLEKEESVNKASYDLRGRVASFYIDVKKGTDLNAAKSLADKILPFLSEEQKSYFDLQVWITSNEDEEGTVYPTVGSKHKTSPAFVWVHHE